MRMRHVAEFVVLLGAMFVLAIGAYTNTSCKVEEMVFL